MGALEAEASSTKEMICDSNVCPPVRVTLK